MGQVEQQLERLRQGIDIHWLGMHIRVATTRFGIPFAMSVYGGIDALRKSVIVDEVLEIYIGVVC
jgi:hypothetical protein